MGKMMLFRIVKTAVILLLFYAVNLAIFVGLWINASINPWNLQACLCLIWVLIPVILLISGLAKYGVSSGWAIKGDLPWGEDWADVALFVLTLPGWPLLLLFLIVAYCFEVVA